MDYLLFHSQFSPSSVKLLEQFPALNDKAISVDSAPMRAYIKKLRIVCVPTLLVLLNNRIVDRVVGSESILTWLATSIYRAEQLQPPQPVPAAAAYLPSHDDDDDGTNGRVEAAVMSAPTSAATTTSLDDLILEDIQAPVVPEERETPIVQTGMSTNTMSLAEALKKERENFDPSTNKKKFA